MTDASSNPPSRSTTDLSAAFEARTALVTGGAGFIGSHLVDALLELGATVHVIDDGSTGHPEQLPHDHERLRFWPASILDEQAVAEAVRGCRYVFHHAAMVSVPQSAAEPVRCGEVNLVGLQRVMEAAREAGVRRIVFASSSAVYGDEPERPSREDVALQCASPYAASKAAGEAFLAAYARCYGIDAVSLRYFNVFGPRQDPTSPYAAAIAAFIDAARGGRPPRIFGDGMQTRDFIAVADVVNATLRAAAAPERLNGLAINIATGRSITLIDVLNALGRVLEKRIESAFEDPRPGDVRHSAAEVSRARDVLGFEAAVGFEEGLRRTLEALD